MDLSGHDNSSSANSIRPDLTIPMPPSFVAGAMAAAAAAAAAHDSSTPTAKQQQQQQQQQQNLAKLSSAAVAAAAAASNNGNTAAASIDPGKDLALLKPDGTKKAVRYRECLKNHAAGIGGHALDGCGEFMPNKEDESSMRCGACDCHRNFHRREVEGEKPICDLCKEDDGTAGGTPGGTARHGGGKRLADFGGGAGGGGGGQPLKKRFRTKFTNEQKERMFVLSEKLGWRIQKHDEAEVAQFCADTGVKRHVLKVWMHNNKHTFGNKRLSPTDTPHDPT